MIRETEFRNRMSWQSRLRDSATARLRDQRGSALAVVLVLVVVLTVAGAAMVNTALTEITIAYNTGDSAAAQYAAEAGLSRAMYELSQNAGWTGTTAAIGDAQYVVTMTSSGSVRLITSTGTRGGGRRVLKAAVAAVPQSASTTVLANATATIGSGSTGLTVSNNFPSSSTSAVQANNKLAAPTAMTVNTTGANIIGGLTANGTISGVTCASWAWTCNASASVRAIPEIDMDSAATTSLKYRAQHTFDADGKYLYFKGGDTGRCNSGGAWTFDAAHTQQCWDYYVNSKSGTLGSGISNPVFFVEFNPSETTSYSTGGSGGGAGTTPGCPGSSENNSDLTETGAALSPLFLTRNRQFIIASAAWIYKTTRQARAFLQRIEDGMTRCGAAALKAEVATTKSAELVSYGLRSIPGTHGWWNYRIVLRIHANGRTIKSFVDMGFGQRGRATSWLILHGAYEPLPASTEAKLVQLVMARMAKPPR